MVVGKLAYEECRRQRLEENKKRMEDLNLSQLSQTLKNASPKPSPAKPAKPRFIQKEDLALVEVRRSSRVANKPPPDYKDTIPLYVEIPRKRSYNRRSLLNRVYASDEAREYAIEKANQVESNLGTEFPSFVKPMLQSHVTGGFWLGLRTDFCKLNLPKRDEIITLVDENDDEYDTKFLAQKTGLSAGWRGFSIAHELVDGDALVFQLVNPTKFKVYIIRVNDSEAVNGALDLLTLVPDAKRIKAGK
ncbi:AP2/B3-like transcriptional factor family protein [Tasmannia lanceolata]|uniref:AP2/B3-like transcriptional factor family protein n=1 Tax=Tasmannia lanceolata TaxID=3420 RepID=UPI004064C658